MLRHQTLTLLFAKVPDPDALLLRYQTLTLPEEDAANSIFVNGTLIHIDATEAPESAKVREYTNKICCSNFSRDSLVINVQVILLCFICLMVVQAFVS